MLYYKNLLRKRVKELKKKRGRLFTLEKFAREVRIEPAYLSRCLNHSQYHPSRELLFRISRAFGYTTLQTEAILSHFDRETAAHEEYRNYSSSKATLVQGYLQSRNFSQVLKVLDDLQAGLDKCQSFIRQDLRIHLEKLETEMNKEAPEGSPSDASTIPGFE